MSKNSNDNWRHFKGDKEIIHPDVEEWVRLESRRQFLSRGMNALGMAAMASLGGSALAAQNPNGTGNGRVKAAKIDPHSGLGEAVAPTDLPPVVQHFAGKAKHVIYLHMVGGPPQMDLYDYKPNMQEYYDKDLPESVRNGQRLTTMTSGQARFPIAPSRYKFEQHGKSRHVVSELLPYTSRMVDDMCFIRSMHTDAINHEPAITYMQTGNQVTGRPCLGVVGLVWPGFAEPQPADVCGACRASSNQEQVQAISARLWSSGYLPGQHAGVSFRSAGDPILYINNPPGVTSQVRRNTLDGLRSLNEMNYQNRGR